LTVLITAIQRKLSRNRVVWIACGWRSFPVFITEGLQPRFAAVNQSVASACLASQGAAGWVKGRGATRGRGEGVTACLKIGGQPAPTAERRQRVAHGVSRGATSSQ